MALENVSFMFLCLSFSLFFLKKIKDGRSIFYRGRELGMWSFSLSLCVLLLTALINPWVSVAIGLPNNNKVYSTHTSTSNETWSSHTNATSKTYRQNTRKSINLLGVVVASARRNLQCRSSLSLSFYFPLFSF